MSSDYADALPNGSRIEGYEIVRVLGAGGFGMTYLGFDDELNIAVAIKEYLPGDLARRDASMTVNPRSTNDAADFNWGLDRFLSEARDLARFDHSNIIRVRRFFKKHGTAYIVMDYAEGETLSDLMKRENKLPEARVKDILLPLLDGLEDVHQTGLLHRDIKPGNIIIKENGRPVLIDFGAARQQAGARSKSLTAIITPGYAPLEQYSSKGNQGAWTDIYALAAVAYKALTGIQPEEATNRVAEDELVPAVEAGKGQASAAFLKTLDWGLSLNGQDRPQTIADFRAALEGAAPAKAAPAGRPAKLKPRNPAEGFSIKDGIQFFKGRIAKIAVAAGLMIALSFPAYLLFDSWMEQQQEAQKLKEQQQEAQKLKEQQQEAQKRKELIRNIQERLDELGYVLEADGILGRGTRERIRAYQQEAVLTADGQPSEALLEELKREEPPTGLDLTKRRAQWGDDKAQYRLGFKYAVGHGVEKDDSKAVFWWRKAAEQGNAVAQYWLGNRYYNGKGIAKDYSKAVFWYRKAAEQGDAAGQYNLGKMYQYGRGVAKDYSKAVFWYRKAAEQGNTSGQDRLGDMYFNGRGVAKSTSRACSWWRKAAAQNNEYATKSLEKYC